MYHHMYSIFILSYLLLWLKSAIAEPTHSLQSPVVLQKPSIALKLKPNFYVESSTSDSTTEIQSLHVSKKLQTLLLKQEFLIGMVSAVTMAKLFPQAGANVLYAFLSKIRSLLVSRVFAALLSVYGLH